MTSIVELFINFIYDNNPGLLKNYSSNSKISFYYHYTDSRIWNVNKYFKKLDNFFLKVLNCNNSMLHLKTYIAFLIDDPYVEKIVIDKMKEINNVKLLVSLYETRIENLVSYNYIANQNINCEKLDDVLTKFLLKRYTTITECLKPEYLKIWFDIKRKLFYVFACSMLSIIQLNEPISNILMYIRPYNKNRSYNNINQLLHGESGAKTDIFKLGIPEVKRYESKIYRDYISSEYLKTINRSKTLSNWLSKMNNNDVDELVKNHPDIAILFFNSNKKISKKIIINSSSSSMNHFVIDLLNLKYDDNDIELKNIDVNINTDSTDIEI